MRIFLACAVRGASPEVIAEQEKYVAYCERAGYTVHYPPRDTKQDASGLEICRRNTYAIKAADEVHVWYSPDSQGLHFDVGVAFALGKVIRLMTDPRTPKGQKSFERMLIEREEEMELEGSTLPARREPAESSADANLGAPQGARG